MREEPIICPDGEHDFEVGRLGCSPTPWNLCRKCPYHEPIYDSAPVTIEITDIHGNVTRYGGDA